ncbi:MAG: formate--tetrahydrofolate ligase [Bacillota bacterium]
MRIIEDEAVGMRPIVDVAMQLGLDEGDLELFGRYKAKVGLHVWERLRYKENGKLIYVTAVTPTPAGEGKTCTAIGLTQALGKLGVSAILCLREPSLGPTFGLKGGAAGGGQAKVLPMEEINLHFTGDLHAVGSAHNLLAALIDNHIFHGNTLRLDPSRISWRRVIDITDRSLRNIVIDTGRDGTVRSSGFDITAASEIMAILCLAQDLPDLKERLGRMVVGFSFDGEPITAARLGGVGAMAALLKEAIKPNLAQTAEGQPAFIHGGPFANIAHGNNSIIATRTALKLADYVVTEGGFAADLGAEKFFDIVSRSGDLRPDIAVLVVSVRALKYHGGADVLSDEDLPALEKGLANLNHHLHIIREVFKLPVVVAVNRFPVDTRPEIDLLMKYAAAQNVPAVVSEVVAKGGEGGLDLADRILNELSKNKNSFRPLYDLDIPLKEKIHLVATSVYGADGVEYTGETGSQLERYEQMGYGRLPVCIAKTQRSLSDDPGRRGAPHGWRLTVKDVRLAAGAGFVIAIAGSIMTMPGLPTIPAAEKIDILPDGTIVGLF